jgi:hypothetical protein
MSPNIKFIFFSGGIPETDTLSISIDTQGERIDTASVVFEGIEIDTITPEYRLYQKIAIMPNQKPQPIANTANITE